MVRLYTDQLNIGYGERLIVKNLSVEIPDKKITTIIGANGCGKSTLLKAATRIISHQSGSIVLDGEHIAKEHTKILARKMAILPQAPESASGLTVGELVSYGRFPYQTGFGRLSKKDYEVIDWALEVTGTIDFKFRPVDALSGGQRQRVWIAMALAQETEIIFLDEPTTYLDLAHQLEVLELLQKLNREQERTIVMGADKTISVVENFDKQLYVFGNNWGRGTEILYQEMKLEMPKKVKEMALKAGYYALSLEVLPEYAGDYVIFSKNTDTDNSFQQTDTYKNIPAVKNKQVFEVNAKEFYFNDPQTLEYQLDFFVKNLGSK
ncbi:ATP-binding cassette domain-containing protein [Paenibacillus sp. V4I5]|nr:ATP-binding cassette domain-containing protein [Paenibacillus sp. V4I5]MDQ0919596.1 ABC-type cobalamin/Fe3+-siderophores transport system ATPase subunit [Paenibacillus sp. V4I5]